MNWSERHLNWIYILSHILWFLVILIFWNIISDTVKLLLYGIIILPLAIWILKKKNRSLWWVILFGWFSPMWLSNKSWKIKIATLTATGVAENHATLNGIR